MEIYSGTGEEGITGIKRKEKEQYLKMNFKFYTFRFAALT